MPRRWLLPMPVLLSAALLAACSTSHPPGQIESASPVEAESSTAAESSAPPPEPAALATFSETVTVTDIDGYQFDFVIDHDVTEVVQDAVADKPGEASLYLGVDTNVEMVNRTEGRAIELAPVAGVTAPLSTPTFFLVTGWNNGSVICDNGFDIIFGDPIEITDPEVGCGIVQSFWRIEQTLEPGATITPEVFKGLPNGAGTAGLPALPEADIAAIEEALLAPDYYLVGYSGGDWGRFQEVCPGDGFDTLSGNGYKLVYSSTGECEPYRQFKQPQAL
ncbi:hypothetical protein O1R50_15190 [Glycomyces luteolus]|uniref:Lipoprotein n=1 Tax=Glycomyces luteolus TaxID=2670330 RepID=A0A9X3SS98_9ACTN|nr:hypothetical protein [Glycomyces luteolus]MDA1360974.1 hypothetical protein [Glycomyces luteolus]